MQNMSWNLRLGLYSFCIFFTSSSYTMCVPFLPVYLLELGAPEETIELWSALVFSSCFLIAGIMAPIWGKISDVKGKKSMALRSAILLFISYGVGGIVTAPIQLLGMRIIQGFANGYLPVILSMVSSQSPKEKVGTSLSFIQSSMLAGTVCGPLIGGLLAEAFGYRASFLIASAFLAFITVVTYIIPDSGDKSEITQERTTILQDLKTCFTDKVISEILALFFIFHLIMMAIQPLLSLYVGQLLGGYSDIAIYAGIAVSVPPMVGAIAAPIWGFLGQRHGYYRSMAAAFMGAGFFLILQSFAPTYTVLMILAALMGLFIVGVVPALNASITLATPPDFKGRAFGAATMATQFGCMFGPLLGAAIANLLAIRYQFAVSGTLMIVMSLYTGYRFIKNRKERIAATEHKAEAMAKDYDETMFNDIDVSSRTNIHGTLGEYHPKESIQNSTNPKQPKS